MDKPGFNEVVKKPYEGDNIDGPPNKKFMLKMKAINAAVKSLLHELK